MSATPQVATGSKIKFGYRAYKSADNVTYTYCSTVISIDNAEHAFDKVDSVLLSSDLKESKRGLAEISGGVKLRRDAGDAAFADIKSKLVSGDTANWDFIILFPDGEKDEFGGYVDNWKENTYTVSDARTVDVTFSVQVKPVNTPAPSSN